MSASQRTPPMLRWGFVGTGNIATWMAAVLKTTPLGTLTAVASRRLDTARSFAKTHGAELAYDNWPELIADNTIDAVYIAAPTSLREDIATAAANAGKHVLVEKPFASLRSLKHIVFACREHDVAFMDATHFVHHPRHAAMQQQISRIGRPLRLDTRFLINQTDRDNIRYNPALEPLGALGDLGWYCMRATVEYLGHSLGRSPSLTSASTRLRYDDDTGAIVAAQGTLRFRNDMTSHWQCAFDAGSVDSRLRLEGTGGSVRSRDFVADDKDFTSELTIQTRDPADEGRIRISSECASPALMFEDFAAAASDASLRESWIYAIEATQTLLDAALAAADA
ncbi:MAG: Gfo/Idh/MocA family oxidoreductase [Pseudomonadota bacterium]